MGNKQMCCSSSIDQSSNTFRQDGRLKTQSVDEIDVNGCKVVLSLGKLFNEDVDTIVIPTTPKMKLNSQVSDYIKKHGGNEVLTELQQVVLSEGGKIPLGQVVFTHSGQMNFDYIFYVALQSCAETSMILLNESCDQDALSSIEENIRMNSFTYFNEKKNLDSTQQKEIQTIYEAVNNCLEKATELGVQSIAFQVMEQSLIHITRGKLASVMLFGIKTFLRDYGSHTTLQEIRISICEAPTIKIYKTYMKQILSDQTETTIEKLFLQEEQLYQHEYKVDSQGDIKRDEFRKFCNGCSDENDKTKQVKNSF